MNRAFFTVATAALVAAAAVGVAEAAGPPVVVTGHGHSFSPGGDGSPEGTLTVTPGSDLRYLNLDEHDHTLTSVRRKNRRPIFDSGTTSNGQMNEVAGVPDLPPGRYPFVCLFHRDEMRGVLIVREV